MGQCVKIDTVFRKRLRVLSKAKSFEPLRDVVSQGASLWQAGFAEAFDKALLVLGPACWDIRTVLLD